MRKRSSLNRFYYHVLEAFGKKRYKNTFKFLKRAKSVIYLHLCKIILLFPYSQYVFLLSIVSMNVYVCMILSLNSTKSTKIKLSLHLHAP